MSLYVSGEERKKAHEIKLNERSEMSICGVEEVVGFDEESLQLKTSAGELFVEGSGIKIGTLNTDDGIVSLTGRINALYYTGDNAKEKKGLFSRRGR